MLRNGAGGSGSLDRRIAWRALQRIAIDAATLRWAPRDEILRADIQSRAPKVRERIMFNAATLDTRDVHTLVERVDQLAATPPNTHPLCWVHGGRYARHLLLDDARQLVGVIDWGDVHIGDPALDLSIAFSFLPPAARPRFRQVYGAIDDATSERARFRAIHYGPLLVEYGIDTADAAIRALGEYALRFAPVGP